MLMARARGQLRRECMGAASRVRVLEAALRGVALQYETGLCWCACTSTDGHDAACREARRVLRIDGYRAGGSS